MKSVILTIFRLSLMTLIFVSNSCQTSQNLELSEQDKQRIVDEIENVVLNFINPNTINFETHTSLRAKNDGYLYAGDGAIVFPDYPSYENGIKSAFEHIEKFTKLQSKTLRTYPLAKDAASCTIEFEGEYITTGNDTVVHNGCWTFVFKKFDGDWKVVQENGTHTGK